MDVVISEHAQFEMVRRQISEERYGTIFVVTAYKTSKVEKYWKEGG